MNNKIRKKGPQRGKPTGVTARGDIFLMAFRQKRTGQLRCYGIRRADFPLSEELKKKVQIRGIAVNGVFRQPAMNDKILKKAVKMMNKRQVLQRSGTKKRFRKKP